MQPCAGQGTRSAFSPPIRRLYFSTPPSSARPTPRGARSTGTPMSGPGARYRRGDPVLHIALRQWADLLIVAPLDANTLAKFALGLSDNFLTCVFRAWDFSRPVVLAPAMNTLMWQSPVTLRHLRQLLADRGDGRPGVSAAWTLDDAAEVFARHAPDWCSSRPRRSGWRAAMSASAPWPRWLPSPRPSASGRTWRRRTPGRPETTDPMGRIRRMTIRFCPENGPRRPQILQVEAGAPRGSCRIDKIRRNDRRSDRPTEDYGSTARLRPASMLELQSQSSESARTNFPG